MAKLVKLTQPLGSDRDLVTYVNPHWVVDVYANPRGGGRVGTYLTYALVKEDKSVIMAVVESVDEVVALLNEQL